MLFRQSDKDDALLRLPARQPQVHSIATVARGRLFKGSVEVAGVSYDVGYAPVKAAVVGRRLQLLGRLTVRDARGQTRTRDQVRATLVGAQGGIGAAPSPPGNQASGATASSRLPEVESTGATSFCGAMYLHFEPLNAAALGVSADLSRVQLNVRFAPVDNSERALQAAFSSAVDALLGRQTDPNAPATAVNELNKLLGAS